MRNNYYWVDVSITLYLVINNTGGHGTNKFVTEYKNLLATKFNVEIIYQASRSPFTNVLDIGV